MPVRDRSILLSSCHVTPTSLQQSTRLRNGSSLLHIHQILGVDGVNTDRRCMESYTPCHYIIFACLSCLAVPQPSKLTNRLVRGQAIIHHDDVPGTILSQHAVEEMI